MAEKGGPDPAPLGARFIYSTYVTLGAFIAGGNGVPPFLIFKVSRGGPEGAHFGPPGDPPGPQKSRYRKIMEIMELLKSG